MIICKTYKDIETKTHKKAKKAKVQETSSAMNFINVEDEVFLKVRINLLPEKFTSLVKLIIYYEPSFEFVAFLQRFFVKELNCPRQLLHSSLFQAFR